MTATATDELIELKEALRLLGRTDHRYVKKLVKAGLLRRHQPVSDMRPRYWRSEVQKVVEMGKEVPNVKGQMTKAMAQKRV